MSKYVTVIRETPNPKPPPIKEIVLRLPVEVAKVLYRELGPTKAHSLTYDLYVELGNALGDE